MRSEWGHNSHLRVDARHVSEVYCLCRLCTKAVNVIDTFRKRALLAQNVDTGNEAGARATDALVEGAVYALDRETRSCTPVES